MTPKRFITWSVVAGIAAGVLTVLYGMAPFVGLLMAVAVGLGGSQLLLKLMIKKRQAAFTATFADAIDVIVRGIRTGLPVNECLSMIGHEMADPVGEEFRLLTEGQKLGMTLDEVMTRANRRMPTAEFKFFAIVLLIQRQTGGNLADTLDKLSEVLRERKKMRDKIKALSSEAKASAFIIGSLPFLVAMAMYFANRQYLMLLVEEPIGNVMLIGAGLWMATGILTMRKMINFDF